jgi:hypothetical protein
MSSNGPGPAQREERWVNVGKVLRVVRSAQRDAAKQELSIEQSDALVSTRLRRYLERAPDQPALVGVTEAAKILKVPKPRVMRFRAQGRLPEPLRVDGPSAPVYVRDEIEHFSREVQEGRDLRRVITEARNVGGVAA